MEPKTFREIVSDFKTEIDNFLKKNNYDKGCIQVILKKERPTGAITDLHGIVLPDIAFFDDAEFILCLPISLFPK